MKKVLLGLALTFSVFASSRQAIAQDNLLDGLDSLIEQQVRASQNLEEARRQYESPIYFGCGGSTFVFYVEGVGNICREQQAYSTAVGYTDSSTYIVIALRDGDLSTVQAIHSYDESIVNKTTLTYWQNQLIEIEGSEQYWQGFDRQLRAVQAAIAADFSR